MRVNMSIMTTEVIAPARTIRASVGMLAFNAVVADADAAIGGSAPDGLPALDDGLRDVRVTEAVPASSASGSWEGVVA
jgi:hypothetical protein